MDTERIRNFYLERWKITLYPTLGLGPMIIALDSGKIQQICMKIFYTEKKTWNGIKNFKKISYTQE